MKTNEYESQKRIKGICLNTAHKNRRDRKANRLVLIFMLTLSLSISCSFINPLSLYAADMSCSKSIYNNDLDGILININTALYNTVSLNRSNQSDYVNVVYDYDGCGWCTSPMAGQLTEKNNKYILALENRWNKYSQFGFKHVSKGSDIPYGKSITVWYSSRDPPYDHVEIVEIVNGNTIIINKGGASNSRYSTRPNPKPYDYCILYIKEVVYGI